MPNRKHDLINTLDSFPAVRGEGIYMLKQKRHENY
jgi:hypothetical protein